MSLVYYPTARLVSPLHLDADVIIPPEMGTPAPGQLAGTTAENLCELAGRICYDSLGKGRGSKEYHEHVLDVDHTSIYEHAVFTLDIDVAGEEGINRYLPWLINRPGVDIDILSFNKMWVTLNLRAALEWAKHSRPLLRTYDYMKSAYATGVKPALDASDCDTLQEGIQTHAAFIAPLVFPHHTALNKMTRHMETVSVTNESGRVVKFTRAYFSSPDRQYVTLYLRASRGFSHEMVRHHHQCAVSQRSTRYVDESESPWAYHPLVNRFCNGDPDLSQRIETLVYDSRTLYRDVQKKVEGGLKGEGVDQGTARKQSRGAARGFLGNALETEMLFTASVRQWRHILHMRAAAPADAEIRALCAVGPDSIFECLKKSMYGDYFNDIMRDPLSGYVPLGEGVLIVPELMPNEKRST